MAKTTPSKEFRTTDLNLAAFLIHEGLEAENFRKGETKGGHPIGGWLFQDEQRVQKLVMEYNEDRGYVNPKTFHQTLSKVRGDMYSFLGIKKGK